MTLPNAENAIIADEKLTEYLLSTSHAEDKNKAFEVTKTGENIHGRKYVVEGHLETPDRRGMMLRTIWMIDRGGTIPRLVSAYPL